MSRARELAGPCHRIKVLSMKGFDFSTEEGGKKMLAEARNDVVSSRDVSYIVMAPCNL